MQIQKSTLNFLKEIRNNNNRPWLEANKPDFVKAKDNFKDFILALNAEMEKHDHIEKNKIFRIYRDVRFSKDKTPYKCHLKVFPLYSEETTHYLALEKQAV